MKPPRIDWDFKHLPNNSDVVEPLGNVEHEGQTLFIAYNLTQQSLLFVWGDSFYGKLISGGE